MAGDDNVAVIMKQRTRARLGVDDSQLLPRLAVWDASDKAAGDNRSNLELIPTNTPNGATSALGALEQQPDADRRAAILEFLANLASLGGSGIQNLNAYVQRLKQYAFLTTKPTALNSLPGRDDVIHANTSNGYLYTTDFTADGTYIYQSTTITGHIASPTWTCVFDSYHQQWQPPGCAACGAGVPCHIHL